MNAMSPGAPLRRLIESAALALGVLLIVGASAKKEMGRITAGRIVTPVTDFHTFRDGTAYERPREPVRIPRLSFAPELIDVGTVTAGLPRSAPFPAAVTLFDKRPESFADGTLHVFAPVLSVANHARNLASAHERFK